MNDIRLYENALFTDITGPAIRPGGLNVTRAGIEACGFKSGAKILDIGCGMGATAEFLEREYGFHCTGIDISEALISEGLKRNKGLSLLMCDAHELPFDNGSMDGVIAECSFSLMEDRRKVLGEIRRVLKDGGCFVLSDIYIREGSMVAAGLKQGKACFLHALELDGFSALLKEYGFHAIMFEDHTRGLKELMADIIMKHGSMRHFWERIWGRSTECEALCNAMPNLKLGYFLTAARLTKRGDNK